MHDYQDLEEYVSMMEARQQQQSVSGQGAEEDVHAQLARKEKDLILAAELGKALLEKNEEISRANEKLTEEYSQQLEVLEQEKHSLRRKLERVSGEYDGRILELQADLEQLRKELREQQKLQRAADREKQHQLRELTDHNHRLTLQVKQSQRTEEQLQEQLQTLQEQFKVRRSNLHDHVSQLEGLREEIHLLEGRKSDLGQRIDALIDERENLNLSLEESGDRIMLLQKQNKEQEQKMRSQQNELDDLRQTNSELLAKLDLLLRKSPIPNGHSSIQDEIDGSAPTSMEEDGVRLQTIDDGIDCDDIIDLFPEGDADKYLSGDLLDCYRQLRIVVLELRKRKAEWAAMWAASLTGEESMDSGHSTMESGGHPTMESAGLSAMVSGGHHTMESAPESGADTASKEGNVKMSKFAFLIRELKALISDMLLQEKRCIACHAASSGSQNLKRLQKELKEKTDNLREKNEELIALNTKVSVQEREMEALREERDHLRVDVESGGWAKDEIVRKAWTMRDQAVARKNTVEIELAKNRIELMNINSQLMEAIQQKVELSQQLDQWQFDMEALLDVQMKKKLKNYELQEERRPKLVINSKGKLFKLFR